MYKFVYLRMSYASKKFVWLLRGPKAKNRWERKTHMAYGKGKHQQDKPLPSGKQT